MGCEVPFYSQPLCYDGTSPMCGSKIHNTCKIQLNMFSYKGKDLGNVRLSLPWSSFYCSRRMCALCDWFVLVPTQASCWVQHRARTPL